MSIRVPADRLGEAMTGRPFAYVLTVGDDDRPHVLAARVTERDGTLRMSVGATTRRNVARRPHVTLAFPPADPDPAADRVDDPDHGAYTLLVDGEARLADDVLEVVAVTAVLHRPAPPFNG